MLLTDSVQSTNDSRNSFPVARELASFVDLGYQIGVIAFRRGFRGKAYSERLGGADIGEWDSDVSSDGATGGRPLYVYIISTDRGFFNLVKRAMEERGIVVTATLRLLDSVFTTNLTRPLEVPFAVDMRGMRRNAFRAPRLQGRTLTVSLSGRAGFGYIKMYQRVSTEEPLSDLGLRAGRQVDMEVEAGCYTERVVPRQPTGQGSNNKPPSEPAIRREQLELRDAFEFISTVQGRRSAGQSSGQSEEMSIEGYIKFDASRYPKDSPWIHCDLWLRPSPGWFEPEENWTTLSTDNDERLENYGRTYLISDLIGTLVSVWTTRTKIPESEISLEIRRGF